MRKGVLCLFLVFMNYIYIYIVVGNYNEITFEWEIKLNLHGKSRKFCEEIKIDQNKQKNRKMDKILYLLSLNDTFTIFIMNKNNTN